MENKDFENRFKEFLSTLSEEKRNEMFAALKKMDPKSREKALVQILKTYEERKLQAAGGKKPVAQQARPQQPKQQPKQQAPQAKPQPKAQPQPASKPQTKPQPKPQQVPQQQPKAQKPKGNPQPIPKQDNKKAPVKKQHEAPISENDFISADSIEKDDVRVKTSGRDIVVVITILVAFVALCFGLKIFLDKKVNSAQEQIASTSETTAATSETTTETTVETTVPEETTPSPTPEPTKVPLAEDAPDLTGMVIVIDPGHQAFTSEGNESVSSSSSAEKPRATSGSVGTVTGICEYELTLYYSLKLRDYLEQCGATVLMTREENEVDVSNQERAELAVNNNADLFLRIHADSANDSLQSGVKVFVPDSGNYTASNNAWGESLGNKVAEAFGLPFMGVTATDVYTGLNYANTIPSFQISLGLLSNSDDEAAIINEELQVNACAAMAQFAFELKPGEAAE